MALRRADTKLRRGAPCNSYNGFEARSLCLKNLTIESKIDIPTQTSKEYLGFPLRRWIGPYSSILLLSH